MDDLLSEIMELLKRFLDAAEIKIHFANIQPNGAQMSLLEEAPDGNLKGMSLSITQMAAPCSV
jgi:hypothetical protein